MTARIGLLGGTFDPPHRGHLEIAAAAADAFSLERVLFVPAGTPWQKDGYSPAEDRFLMTVLACEADPRFAVSRVELDRDGPTYSVDTLAMLQAHHGGDARFFFILGADAAANITSWFGFDRLQGLTEVIAVPRDGIDLATLAGTEGMPRLHRLEIGSIGVSSTSLRATLAGGGNTGADVPASVGAYIGARALYRA